MTLEEVIARAESKFYRDPWDAPASLPEAIAKAVRDFLGSHLSQASAMQIGPSNEGHRIAIYFDDHKVAGKAFAALSSITGDE